jgi:hypothetical protein
VFLLATACTTSPPVETPVPAAPEAAEEPESQRPPRPASPPIGTPATSPDADVGTVPDLTPEMDPVDAPPPTPPPAPREPAPATAGPLTAPAPIPDVPILDGAVLPRERILAFYGNPASTRMGILGELPPDEMLARLDREVEAWRRADPFTPVRPALHLITVMAAGDPGPDDMYRIRQPSSRIQQVMDWAARRDGLVFLDIQPGRSTVQAELPRLERWLTEPHVHLALDPEWAMGSHGVPGGASGP